MKKRLLSALAVALCASGALAADYAQGEFIYTMDGRFQVTGANLLEGLDFADGLGNLTAVSGNTPTDTFIVVTGGAPDGGNSIQVNKEKVPRNSTTADNKAASVNIFLSASVNAGNIYVVTYKVKGAQERTTSTTGNNGRNTNFQSFFFDDYGKHDAVTTTAYSTSKTGGASWVTYGTEWTQVAYNYTCDAGGYLNILLYNLQAEDQFCDFGIYPVSEVNDDRLLKDALDQMQFYVDNKEFFPNGQGLLTQILGMLTAGLETVCTPDEQVTNILGPIYESGGGLQQFLDNNSVDISGYYDNFGFDEVETNNIGRANTSIAGWTSSTGTDRWGIEAATGSFETLHAFKNIQAGYTLGASVLSQTVDLPAGRYLYVTMAQGYMYHQDGRGGNSNYRHPNFSQQISGFRYFVNNDTLDMDSVPTWRGRTFQLLTDELPAGDKTIGFCSPTPLENRGGDIKFDNMQLRLLGATEEEVKNYYSSSQLVDAQYALKVMIDSATNVMGMSAYVFGKQTLQDSINASKDVYDNYTSNTDETVNILNAQMVNMRAAIRALYALNAEYTALGEDIALCESEVNDDSRPDGADVFRAAIETAKQYYNAQTADSRDSAALVANDTELMNARTVWHVANASKATPAELYIVNSTFADGTTGWEQDGRTGTDRWQTGSSADFTDGACIYYNRGNSAADIKYVYQDVDISASGAGVYEFKAQLAVHNSKNTTETATGVYFYVGGDSIEVCTNGDGSGNQSRGEIREFTVRTVLDEVPEGSTLRVGLDKPTATNINILYMGSCHLLFYGDYATYRADSIAEIIQPTRDSLQAEIDRLNALSAEIRNPNNVDITAFTSAVSAAQGVCSNTASTLDELLAQFDILAAAEQVLQVSGVWPAEGKSFDLSWMITDPKFTLEPVGDTGAAAWTIEGDTIDADENGLAAISSSSGGNGGVPVTTKYSQTLDELPNGHYLFALNATYRNGLSDAFTPSKYESNEVYYVFAGDSTVAVKGLLTEGAASEDGNTWIYNDATTLTLYNYRHTPNASEIFAGGFLNNYVEANVTDGTLSVGFQSIAFPISSWLFAQNPQLYFFGSEVPTGIDDVEKGKADNNDSIDDLKKGIRHLPSGLKVADSADDLDKLPAGIYLVDGKKVQKR